MTAAVVLRPEPGNAQTAARLEAAGVAVVRQPLFAVRPLRWTPPDPADFDALVLTSVNAVRHAGRGLAGLCELPVLAVGAATAAAAERAGLTVAIAGEHDASTLAAAATAQGYARLLHLAGRDHAAVPGARAIPVYASEPLPVPAGVTTHWSGAVLLLHSVRAARRAASLVDRDATARASVAVAALSAAVCDAAGPGWASAEATAAPTDAALVSLVLRLIDPSRAAEDKRRR